MARETRASGNAAAAAAAAAASTANGTEAASGSSGKKDAPSTNSANDASPSKKRKRGSVAAAEPAHINGSTAADGEESSSATSPAAPTVLGKRLKVVLKTRKASGSASVEPTGEAAPVNGDVVVPSADDTIMEDADEEAAADKADGVAGSGVDGEGKAGKEEDAGPADTAPKRILDSTLRDGLLSVMLAMQKSLLPGLAEHSNLVDIPLMHSRPASSRPTGPAVERPNKKGKKGKGKSKQQESTDIADEASNQIEGEWTMRRALSGGAGLSIEDLEAHLFELAGQCVPAPQNPFHPYPSTLAGPSARMPATVLSDYFSALHGVVARICTEVAGSQAATGDVKPIARFALHQRLHVPGFGTVGREGVNQGMVDWFSGLIAMPEVLPKLEHEASGKAKAVDTLQVQGQTQSADIKEEDGIVTRLSLEKRMGHAQPVLVAPTDVSGLSKLAVPGNKLHVDPQAYAAAYGQLPRRGIDPPITLGQSILTQASRKLATWKNRRERDRPMGWIGKPVKFPQYETTFTPSFAPALDSSDTTGGWGYEQTVDALQVRAAKRAWLESAWGPDVGAEWEEELEDAVHEQSLEGVKKAARQVLASTLGGASNDNIDPSLVEAVAQSSSAGLQTKLDENARLMKELMTWQDIRVRRGQAEVTDEREHETAARLAKNLAELASHTTPAKLLPLATGEKHPSRPPLAVMLAEKVITTAGPNIRGTLDPQRSRALIDNTTVRLKADAVTLARPPPPAMPSAPRPPPVMSWGRPAMPPYGRPPTPGYGTPPPMKYPPPSGTPQPYRPPMPAYGSPLAYPVQRPPLYPSSPAGLSPYPSPSPRLAPGSRPPSAARGVGAGMGLSIQNIMPGTPGYPAARPSGLRGQL